MSRLKSLAALVVAAVLALAVPLASASATTTAPVARAAVGFGPGPAVVPGLFAPVFPFAVNGRLAPGSLPCLLLVSKIRTALALGLPTLANLYSQVFIFSGCGGAAI